jgi:IclR family acetate operon transcriptional repressor
MVILACCIILLRVSIEMVEIGGSGVRLQTLDRGLRLLEWVASNPGNATVRLAAEALGINTTTCYHLVDTLLARGYLVRVGRGQLEVGTALSGLSSAFLQEVRPMVLLSDVVETLLHESQESVFMVTWDGNDVILLMFQEGPQHLTVSGFSPGFRGFAYARASGKAILAYLPDTQLSRYLATHDLVARTPHSITDQGRLRQELAEIRTQGWAYDGEEFALGIYSVGAPFFGANGRVLGALAAAVPASRHAEATERCRKAVLGAAEQASRILGYVGAFPPRSRR